jgi:beta-carotene 15,15'-dioxygenase
MTMWIERALRIHGMAFCVIAALAVVASLLLPRLPQQNEFFISVALIALLGVPHGAFDALFGQRLYDLRRAINRVLFAVAYVSLGALVIALWWIFPLIFLVAFLLITIMHFSADPLPGTRWISRLLHGGAIIVLPNLWHAEEVLALFRFLVYRDADGEALLQLSAALQWLALPWLAALLACALYELRASLRVSTELLAVAAVAVVVPPLLAFATFFCAMHGSRHVLRTLDYAGDDALRPLLRSVGWAMLVVAAGAVAAFFMQSDTAVDARLVKIVFVGLAALTVPHMLLVERVRFRGWR